MRRRDCRPVDGIFLLDKAEGISSNRALQEVKRRFRACKAGHTGSLDPLASGLLPICLGEATKVSQYLLDADKTYRTTLELGVSTTTYDREGEVTAVKPVAADRARIEAALAAFRGDIMQTPPAFSAIKQGGQPVYKKARAGKAIELPARPVTVHELGIVGLEGNRLTLEMRVSKGTYVRSLAHDLGEALGCGAHVVQLRRLALGRLSVDQAHPIEALGDDDESSLLAADVALAGLPPVRLSGDAARSLLQGQRVFVGPPAVAQQVRVYGADGEFLGIGELSIQGWLTPRRLRAEGIQPRKSVEDGGSRR